MTERNLLIKFCVSSPSSNSNQLFSAIAADAPTSVRIFGSSSSSAAAASNSSETELLYTASAIPHDELLGTGANDSSLIGAHSTINESLTAMNMSNNNNNSDANHNNNNQKKTSASSKNNNNKSNNHHHEDAALSNFVKSDFTCDLIMGTSSGRVSLFDCVSGQLRWSRFVPDGSNVAVRAVAASGGYVFASTARHTISVFEASSGRVVFNGASSSVSTATSSSNNSKSSNISSAFATTIGTAKSMSAYTDHKDNTIYIIVGGLQPVIYRMSGAASSSSASKILEPYSFCRVQQAPCDQVSLFESSNGVLLASTCVYSEGVIRVWNLTPSSSSNSNNTAAICSHVFDISASNGSSAMTNLHQRFSFINISTSENNQQQQELHVVASTVSGTMFLWNKKNVSVESLQKESTNSIAPSATLLSPNSEAKSVSRNNRRVPLSTSSRIVCAFFNNGNNNNNSNTLVVLRRNWSSPVFQAWSWNALVSSSTEVEGADAVSAESGLKILPASASASTLSAHEQAKRLIHLPASTGKMSAHAALKGLDLPAAGVHAFPKVSLFRASEVGELPTYQKHHQQQQADAEDDGEDRADGEVDGDDQELKMSALAAVAKRKRAGVAPALYQALHAEDVSLIMEILNVADRSDADRNATVQSLSLPYIVQLLYLLSKRVIDDGTAKTPLHAWVSSIMQLRGNELFQIILKSKQQQQQQRNEDSNKINADSLRAALLPLLEHYRGILSSVGNQIAFTAGRASIFKSVKRRASNIRHKRKQETFRFEDGPRFIDTTRGVIAKTGEEERSYHADLLLRKKLKRQKKFALLNELKKGKFAGAKGNLIGDDGNDDDDDDDDRAEDILGEDGAVISSSKKKFKEFDEEEGEEGNDDEDDDEEDDDQQGEMDEADLLPGEDDEEDEDEEGLNFDDLEDELGPLDEEDEEEGADDEGVLQENDDDEDEEEGDDDDDDESGNNNNDDDDSDDEDDDDSDQDLEEDGVVEHLKSGKKAMKLHSKVQYD